MNVQSQFAGERSGRLAELATPRRRRRIAVAALILAALALAAWLILGRAAPPPAPAELPHVSVIVPGRTEVAGSITATGSLAARREMPVGVAGEGGMVAQVLVDAGAWVRSGQTLAIIDRSVQAEQSSQLSAQVRVAQADASLAQSQLDRAQKLVAGGFISKADIDQKTATRDAARARVALAQAQLGEVRARIGQLAIRAPAAGLVLERNLDPGQVVSAASGALFRLAKDGQMELKAAVAEQDLARLHAGLAATVTPVGGTAGFKGSIWLLSPVIDPLTRQGQARIALAYDPALRPGGFASAKIASGRVDAPLVPESAVQTDAKGSYVFIVDGGGRVARRGVTLGDASEAGLVILSGLAGDERVVLSAGAFLNPGEKVVAERVSARG